MYVLHSHTSSPPQIKRGVWVKHTISSIGSIGSIEYLTSNSNLDFLKLEYRLNTRHNRGSIKHKFASILGSIEAQ